MAGIISNVDSDVQKLRKLKNEIEEVKKALKSINIKVDIDIAEGLQSQLKSLTVQYKELVNNIAQAEAKVLLSAKKINDASEKIIQAQEKMSKTAGTPTQIGSIKSQEANAVETASIQAQAKAYEDLKAEINGILGTREANVKRMIDEMNAIRLINAEIKKITKSQGESTSLSSAQQKRLEQLNNSLLTHKTALSEVRQTLNNNVKLDNAATTSMNGLSQSLSRMRIAYRELTEEERNSPIGKELLASINQADAKIKELDATIGNHQRNVGDYAKQWNGLQYQMQMVARELPNFAINPQIGIMSLTNNIPYLVDELKKAKDAHKAYIAEVKAGNKELKTVPSVGRQVLSSLLNWQTAIIMGITLITAYRKEITNWASSLFSAKKALSETYQSLEDYQKKAGETSGSVLATLERLSEGWKRLGSDVDAQKKYILDNKDAINSMGVSVNDAAEAERLFNSNKDTFVLGILQRAKAAATMELAAEEYKKAVQKMMEADAMPDKKTHRYSTATNVIDIFKASTWQTIEYDNPDKLAAQKQAEDFIKSGTQLIQKYAQFSEEERKTLEPIDIKTTKTIIEGSVEAIEAVIALKQQSLKKVTDPKEYKRIEAEIKVEQAKLRAITGEPLKSNQAEKIRQQQQKSSEELLALRRRNQQDEIDLMEEGRKKILQQIDADFEARKAEITKKAHELAEVNKKAGLPGLNSNGLTSEQQVEIDRANKLNADSRAKAEGNMYKSETEAMRNYLKEYGTFQQQKLSIAEEYAEKIRKAQNEGERLTFERQRDAALQQVEVKAIKQSVDWGSVFGEFSSMFKDQLQPTIDRLKSIAQSDEFKSSSLQDQQTLYELISKLEQSNAAWDSDIFQKVSDDMTAYQTAMQNHLKAQERERLATEALAQAKRDLAVAEQSGNVTDALNAQVKVTEAQLALNAAAQDVQDFGVQVQETTSNLQESSTKAVNMFQNLESGLKGLTSGSLQGVGQGLMQLDKLFNKGGITKDVGNALAGGFQSLLGKDSKASKAINEALGSAGMAGEIISGVLGILDLLKDGFSNILVSLQDTVFGAVEGILNDVLSGDIIIKPLENSIKHMGNILDTVTFGGFKSLMNIGSNAKEVQETIDRLTDRNETLGKSIDRLTDVMEKEAGSKSISAYKQSYEYQQEHNANTLQIAREQARYSGSHHSWQKYMGWTNEQIQWARKNVDENFSGTGSLWGLTPEQMKMLLSNADIYEQISGAGKGGYGNRVMEKLEAYADNAEKLEGLTEKINESLMQVSFDGLRDSFLDSLMDMNKDAKSFSEDFSEYMQRALLNFSIGEMFDEDLKEWYTGIAELMKEQEGKLTEDQLNAARQDYDDMVQKAIEERNKIAELTGYTGNTESTSQSSTKRGFGTEMTHEDAGELSGRFTALRIAGEEVKNQSVIQSQSLNLLTARADTILSVNTETRNIADETRTILANSYLELVQISENTGNSAKYLKDIKADIAEVKKNTSKL